MLRKLLLRCNYAFQAIIPFSTATECYSLREVELNARDSLAQFILIGFFKSSFMNIIFLDWFDESVQYRFQQRFDSNR